MADVEREQQTMIQETKAATVSYGKRKKKLVSETRKYLVLTVAQSKAIVSAWLEEINLSNAVKMGLPEVDDRYHIWRVPLCNEQGGKMGEAVIDAYTTELLADRTTKAELIEFTKS